MFGADLILLFLIMKMQSYAHHPMHTGRMPWQTQGLRGTGNPKLAGCWRDVCCAGSPLYCSPKSAFASGWEARRGGRNRAMTETDRRMNLAHEEVGLAVVHAKS